jgi:hypothetical protein
MIPRKHPRFIVQIPAFFTRDCRGRGDITNLSMGGCCIQNVEAGVDVKGILTLYLHLSAHEQPLRVDAAHVRWSAASNFGLSFLFLESRELQRLTQYVERLGSDNRPTGAAFRITSPS